MAAAREQQVSDPASASEAWAAIDRAVVEAAAYIPFGNNLRQDFVSRRVGNTLVHPVTGPLIAQMWIHMPPLRATLFPRARLVSAHAGSHNHSLLCPNQIQLSNSRDTLALLSAREETALIR